MNFGDVDLSQLNLASTPLWRSLHIPAFAPFRPLLKRAHLGRLQWQIKEQSLKSQLVGRQGGSISS